MLSALHCNSKLLNLFERWFLPGAIVWTDNSQYFPAGMTGDQCGRHDIETVAIGIKYLDEIGVVGIEDAPMLQSGNDCRVHLEGLSDIRNIEPLHDRKSRANRMIRADQRVFA